MELSHKEKRMHHYLGKAIRIILFNYRSMPSVLYPLERTTERHPALEDQRGNLLAAYQALLRSFQKGGNCRPPATAEAAPMRSILLASR